MNDHNAPLEALEARAPTLFVVAGMVMIVFAANTYLKTFAGTSYPVIQAVIAPSGFLVGVVGLFGLSHRLADRTPRLAQGAAGIALITVVGWVAIIVNGIGKTIGVLSQPSGPLAVIPLVVIVAMILGFGLFGAAILYTGAYSWIVGALLVLESAMFLVLVLDLAPYLLLVDFGHILAYLGIGIALWTTDVPSDSTNPAPDSAV